MQKTPNNAAKGGFGAQDVMFVLFKHKWLILLFALAGFGAAGYLFANRVPLYKSHSKLLVRYVIQRENVDEFQAQSAPQGAPGKPDSVINTEIEILTSVDLAISVAEKIGVERLIPGSGGNASLSDGAGVILGGLQVGVGKSTKVLNLVYGNADPELSKDVLRELVDAYFQKHLQIHRSAANFDLVSKQTAEVLAKLRKTEQELNKMRTEHGIVSLADATGALTSQKTRIQEEILNAKAELGAQEASSGIVEHAAMEAAQAEGQEPPKAIRVGEPIPPSVLSEYRAVSDVLATLQKSAMELRLKFKSGNRLLVLNQEQIANNQARLKSLVTQYPDLEQQAEVIEGDARNPKWNGINDKARIAATRKRIEIYEAQLKEIARQFSEQYAIGAKIEELDRRRGMEEAEYKTLEVKLKTAKIDLDLDPSRMPNITVVQHPTNPIKSFDEKTTKIILGLAGGGLALGLGLAFLIEMLFDRRVKRPLEIQTRMQLPLLLSIPFIRRKERGTLMLNGDTGAPRIGTGAETTALSRHQADEELAEPQPRKPGHFILPYSETIRDRIIFNFEVNNVTHKPKLVAVTGLSEGAGASTVAAGLAKSFSEIPGMKVLLVDLSSYHPEENPLFGEIPRHSLNGALHLARNTQFRETPQNLYYASATARRDESGLTTFSPVHLYELMPHLQASQYDYIVFDMPPIDQTSRTLTMAGLMDKVLLVLDAENTSRDALMWGYSELIKGRADVSCIFNKTRAHAPGWLVGGA
jgi:succinoglycan biosynthesis transport protein ExoP